MVEFALVFPLFLATMLVIFDTGRFIAAYSTLASSVQNGARVALICAVGASLSSACETAITSAVSTGVLSNTSPTITITQGTGPAGPNVTIAATMPHQIDPTFAALLGTTFVTTVTISHQATVTVAGPTP